MDEKDNEIRMLKEQVAALQEVIRLQAETIVLLQERIAELERILGLNSGNSSKPPSSDGLRKKPAPESLRLKGAKSSGGQLGHKGSTLAQVIHPTSVVHHAVDACESCGKTLQSQASSRVVKRQVFDIPEPKVEVVEHQAEVKVCTCGHHTMAPFPKGVTAPVQYGARMKALAVYLSAQQLIPEDRLQQVFADLFGLSVSTATLVCMNEDCAKQVAGYQEDVLNLLKVAPIKHLDETGFRMGGKTQWLHVISTDQATHYRVSAKRGDLLEGLSGILVHDHWKPYFTLENVEHALCNAHHLRELKALEEIEKEPWAHLMSRLLRLLSRLKKPPIERVMRLYDRYVRAGLAFHRSQPPLSERKKRTGHNLLLRLEKYKEAVLRFLTTPGVPFTNNQAEQDIRMMKVKQKISGGFRTTQGANTFCILRGFLSTQRKQGHNIFHAIQRTCTP